MISFPAVSQTVFGADGQLWRRQMQKRTREGGGGGVGGRLSANKRRLKSEGFHYMAGGDDVYLGASRYLR